MFAAKATLFAVANLTITVAGLSDNAAVTTVASLSAIAEMTTVALSRGNLSAAVNGSLLDVGGSAGFALDVGGSAGLAVVSGFADDVV